MGEPRGRVNPPKGDQARRGVTPVNSPSAWAGQAAVVQVGPRSASSASRHSTSSRSAPPPEKLRVTTPAGSSVCVNSTERRLRTASSPAGGWRPALPGLHPLEPQSRAAAPILRRPVRRGLPVEAVQRHDEAVLFGPPQHFGRPDHRILEMGRNHFEVFAVEGNEFQQIHGTISWAVSGAASALPPS